MGKKIKIKETNVKRGHRIYDVRFPNNTSLEGVTERGVMDALKTYPPGCKIEYKGTSKGDVSRFNRTYNS